MDTLSTTDQQYKLMQEYNDLLREQNYLLQKQNHLLQRQNKLAQKTAATRDDYGREILVEDIDRDEIRSGILVTSHRKKLWNVQLNLIKEFDRICRKHNLRWFAYAGTLLGAVRHKGYIPWDDDVDVVMLRPEYEKFRRIIASEIKPPYLLDAWYNYRREDDEPSELTDMSLPLITNEYVKNYYPICFPFFPIIKIRDTRTFFLEYPGGSSIHQSIFLDIFPLDTVPPFAEDEDKTKFEVARLIYAATVNPQIIRDAMEKNEDLIVDYDSLQKFIKLPYKQRGLRLENILAKNFFMSEHLGLIKNWSILNSRLFEQSKDYRDVTYLPFEKFEMPVPIGYDSILTDLYGNWRKPVIGNTHSRFYSAEIPWNEYKQRAAFK